MIKQVILYRRDLTMRKGKIAAQVAHASMAVFFNRINRWVGTHFIDNKGMPNPLPEGTETVICIPLTDDMAEWVDGLFAKIVLSVEDEVDLLRAYQMAKEAGIPCSLITDAGKTEFKKPCETCSGYGYFTNDISGERRDCEVCGSSGKVSAPTHTTVALGPARSEAIDPITGPEGAVKTKLA